MKYYKPNELRAGMRLAKQIYNKQGVLLYKRGFVLTDQIIAGMQKFGLLGVLVLEPAEALPPISDEELEFDQLQTTWMLRLRDSLVAISKNQPPQDLPALVSDIVRRFGTLNRPIAFSPTIRSSEDYTYKHSVCTAILCAMIAHKMQLPEIALSGLVTAALLADFGYLYVPKDIMAKQEDELSNSDLLATAQYRNKASALLKRNASAFGIQEHVFSVLDEFLNVARKEDPELATNLFHTNTRILITAEKYDRMTAMSIGHTPITSVQALRHLESLPTLYEPKIVQALSNALSILPTGQCVELSTNNRGLIIAETPGDQFHPQVLDLTTNTVYDLSSPAFRDIVEIKDLMTSMDLRYPFDEQSIKHFTPDKPLQTTTRRIRMRLAKARKREEARRARATNRK